MDPNPNPTRDRIMAEAVRAPYHRIFVFEGDGFAASVLELPGCIAGGPTIQGANEELDTSIESWVGEEVERGRDIPRPLNVDGYAGRITLRVNPSVHERALVRAGVEGVSLNSLLETAIASYLGDLPKTEAHAPRVEASPAA